MSSFQSTTPPTDPDSPLKKKRTTSWTDLWLKTTKTLKPNPNPNPNPNHNHLQQLDRTRQLKDDLLLNIFSRLPSTQINSNSLVCKRWLCLHGRLVTCLKLLDFGFLLSGRLVFRFPNLTHVDLINGCVVTPFNSALLLSNRVCSMHIGSRVLSDWRVCEENLLGVEVIDKGLEVLASGCPNLRKLVVIGASEVGLLSVAKKCLTLQELELHRCDDGLLRGIGDFENLQILRVLGIVDGFYSSLVTDIGLTILAQGCRRLVKLELSGCEGSFDGIKAIGQCCQMLEELTLCDHRMDGGWLAALSFCENLKSLKFLSCQGIDPSPGPDEYLGSCPALETLHLERCQLRDRTSIAAMFKVCEMVRQIIIQDCWGLDDDMFVFTSACRRVNALTLEGCLSLTTQGLESVLLTWNELQDLRIESCKNIKDGEISPALSTLFSVLKELKWRPDTKTLLALNLEGTGMGNKGGKFFRKS